MALPLLALPIAMGVASAGGAVAQAAAARKQAEAQMPEAYKRRLRGLEQREAEGELGLSEAQRRTIESTGAAQRAGQMADLQARQLQQAQANSAISGRDLFMQDLASQDAQTRSFAQQQRVLAEADAAALRENQQMLLELQQRQADAEAGRKMANRQLAGDLFGAAATTAGSIYGAQQMQAGYNQMVGAAAGSQQMRDAQARMFQAQMAMQMAGAYGAPRR